MRLRVIERLTCIVVPASADVMKVHVAVLIAMLSRIARADDVAPSSGATRLHPEASLRLRSELGVFADIADRYRIRLRARAGALYDVGPGLDIGGRLSTGSEDPTSSQLTLGEEFDKQPLKLDRLFVRLRRGEQLVLMAGKLPAVFRSRRLIWDPDVSPEGLNQAVTFGAGRGLVVHVTFGEFILVEVENARDAFALVGQTGIAGRRGPFGVSVDMGVHDYPNVTKVVLAQSHGSNTVDATGHLVNEYRLIDALLEASVRASSMRLETYLELTRNIGAARDDDALAVGAELSWRCPALRLGYEFRRVERDAILDALAESSWYTDRTAFLGHRVSGRLKLSADWTVASSLKWMRAIAGPAHRELEWLVDAEWAL
jgi:hypothetical protein